VIQPYKPVELAEENYTFRHTKRITRRANFTFPPSYQLSFFVNIKTGKDLVINAFSLRNMVKTEAYQDAVFVFQKRKKFPFEKLKPWQRPCFLPGASAMAAKPKFQKVMKNYARSNGNKKIPFVIEAYGLGDVEDRIALLTRLREGGGMDEAWVLKDNKLGGRARGVSTLGPNSNELYNLLTLLMESNETKTSALKNLVVQKYVTNVLTYNGRKFHIRSFVLVTSIDPLIVHFHPGYLTISPVVFNETDFSKQMLVDDVDHPMWVNLTKEEADRLGDFVETQLKPHVVKNPHLHHISDPEAHVRNQMKAALEEVFVAFRQYFDLGLPYRHLDKFPTENAFEIFGIDFLVDKDLQVLLIEINTNPHLSKKSVVELAVHNVTLPEMVEMISEVYEKQIHNETVLPLQSQRAWELIYADV
jgi:hypothetical protein